MSTIVAQTLSNGTVSTSTANCIQGSAKAWVNFNGVTPAVTSSFNVSSVTRQATGQFTITMTNAMIDKNYVVLGGCINGTTPTVNGIAIMGGNDQAGTGPNTQTTTVFSVGVFANNSFANLPVNNVAVFR